MTWMDFIGHLNACRTIVEVWAGQALVSNADDLGIAAIANSLVLETSSLLAQRLDVRRDG